MIQSLIAQLRQKTTIKFRINLFAGLMLFLFYFASIYSFFSHLNNETEEHRKTIHFVVTELLTKTAAQALRRGNKDQLESVISTLLESTEIREVVVIDSEGEVFVSLDGSRPNSGPMEKLSVDVLWKKITVDFNELESDTESIVDQHEKIGVIHVDIDQNAISDLVWAAMIGKSYALFAALILSMPIVYVLATSLVIPLREIMEDLHRFESGNYSENQPKSNYRDEYALLSTALRKAGNAVVKKTREVENVNEKLRSYTEQLENQIKIAIEARKAADEANELKDMFVANITHEFNTPLSGITSGVELIEQDIYELLSYIDDIDPENGVGYHSKFKLRECIFKIIPCIDTARYASSEIRDMVRQILASTEGVYPDIRLNEGHILLNQSLMTLVESHVPYANQKALDLKTTWPDCEDVWVVADWVRVAQVLNALIDNAIKFTERGHISVGIRILTTTQTVALFVKVQDTGIGISEKEKDVIFNLFQVGQHPRKKVGAGIGTGLAIAQKITEKLNGNLSLKSSTLQSGSCFTFDCTFNKLDPNDVAPADKEGLAKRKANGHINLLYVEDSIVNQMIFKGYCTRHGADLTIAGNGEEGFEKYVAGHFDALIVDCYMPLSDGFALVSKIREYEKHEGSGRLLIFALTGDGSDKNRRRCKKCGFDEFLEKPYTENAHARLVKIVSTNKNALGVIPS